jgi:hypothetical protein
MLRRTSAALRQSKSGVLFSPATEDAEDAEVKSGTNPLTHDTIVSPAKHPQQLGGDAVRDAARASHRGESRLRQRRQALRECLSVSLVEACVKPFGVCAIAHSQDGVGGDVHR